MKVTKSVLAGVIASVSVAGITASCEKELIIQNSEVNSDATVNEELPVYWHGERESETRITNHYDCPACGMG